MGKRHQQAFHRKKSKATQGKKHKHIGNQNHNHQAVTQLLARVWINGNPPTLMVEV